MFYRRILVFCGFVIVGHSGMCSRLPDDPPPMARFLKATQLAEMAYKNLVPDLLERQLDKPDCVTLEGVKMHLPYFVGTEGKEMADYFSPERSGFQAYIMKDLEEVIVAIRGTKDPLHMLLDLHIIMATAEEDPKTTLNNLIKNCFELGFFGKIALEGALSLGVKTITFGSASTPESQKEPLCDAAEDTSFMAALGAAAKDALVAGVVEATPPEIKALYNVICERDPTDFKRVLQERFQEAIVHAKKCIGSAQSLFNTKGKKLRVVGHSLGGTLATIAMAQLHAEGTLAGVDFQVNAVCSPGSQQLLVRLGTDIHPAFQENVFNLVRKGDIVSNFGIHVGQTVFLDAIESEPAVASNVWSYLNPSFYTVTPIVRGLKYLKDSHSSQRAVEDVRRLLNAA
jgi:hypothetical protein